LFDASLKQKGEEVSERKKTKEFFQDCASAVLVQYNTTETPADGTEPVQTYVSVTHKESAPVLCDADVSQHHKLLLFVML